MDFMLFRVQAGKCGVAWQQECLSVIYFWVKKCNLPRKPLLFLMKTVVTWNTDEGRKGFIYLFKWWLWTEKLNTVGRKILHRCELILCVSVLTEKQANRLGLNRKKYLSIMFMKKLKRLLYLRVWNSFHFGTITYFCLPFWKKYWKYWKMYWKYGKWKYFYQIIFLKQFLGRTRKIKKKIKNLLN